MSIRKPGGQNPGSRLVPWEKSTRKGLGGHDRNQWRKGRCGGKKGEKKKKGEATLTCGSTCKKRKTQGAKQEKRKGSRKNGEVKKRCSQKKCGRAICQPMEKSSCRYKRNRKGRQRIIKSQRKEEKGAGEKGKSKGETRMATTPQVESGGRENGTAKR